ncbi:MAG: hypothetical protein A2268_00335 [Candidatus Raymondbacteria bacterium RifOxyA12_full_50_37]|uniref:Sialidase domain-containing protein n=1 Tax=Candidatus Raymondbacteria bacterium RIFOXYD12_FULL_49_13 TaxID=1817890 RepID=A0A1F7F346_UNCRA|nr:MAG: hypothetical protein A2268_00335 [Candidatus Raymondbacteria bacterium RifOxyA12_full_50_37]OGJ92764.1 MAG: hypothetical protein A2248_04385 [Candidatus Raymondbacteria bacterium RIFOXYA2_FULL_49_16]OGK00967.1 MAG: hypothetical protein A2519_17045 [Candidatus Raymondbacteria bacterium RIFOXYD12_FULL_49_13]OGK02468.1 MAG: hypothetical protein A2487_20840 [Candidatus Raymondbacteria bacterium RifOxyC12_full_50_8]OGP44540.1 MAG: hypothetical protein A2324_10180 [Candidatus Raymondbacteria 
MRNPFSMIFFCLGIVISYAVCPASINPDEKLLLGFEDNELVKIGVKTQKGDTAVWAIPSYAVSTDPFERPRIWKTIQKNIQGKQSLVYIFKLAAPGPKSEYSTKEYPDYTDEREMRQASWALPIFKNAEYGWATSLWDSHWNGYDLFRVDIYADHDAKIWTAIEDREIEPPVTRAFIIKAGTWQTLEIDLKKARKYRNLDLDQIINVHIGGHADDTAYVMLDNIRLAQAGAPSHLPIVTDTSSYEPETVKDRSLFQVVRFSRPMHKKLNATPEPMRVRIKNMTAMMLSPCGWINYYDDNRILLVFINNEKKKGSYPTLNAVQTLNGGKTWTGFGGDEAPTAISVRNLDHGTSRGQPVGLDGANILISSGFGCAGWGTMSPRQKAYRILPNGEKGWTLDKKKYVFDGDIRHCGSNSSVIQLEDGKLWATWGHFGRELTMGVHAKFSDDLGMHWQSFRAGKTPEIPGSFDDKQAINSYFYKQTRIFKYKNSVGVVWQDRDGLHVEVFNGTEWRPIPLPYTHVQINYPETGFRPPLSAISLNEHIFITATNLRGLLHWDGTVWRHELDSAWDGGMLSLSQNTVMLITPAPGLTEIDREKWIQSDIVYYIRSPSGSWSEKRSLSKGPSDIFIYWGIWGISVPVACTGKPGEGILIYAIPNPYFKE